MDLLRARAMTLMQLGRLDEAAEQFAQMALEPTNSVQDEWALAAIDLLRGQFEPGAARLDASIARGPRVLRNLDTALLYLPRRQLRAGSHPLACGLRRGPGLRDLRRTVSGVCRAPTSCRDRLCSADEPAFVTRERFA